uniref:FIIND domain-containing protein n=2 Tax=Echeneis naucrates TaxID=173247 RepID=A0A665VJY2_ECHNA
MKVYLPTELPVYRTPSFPVFFNAGNRKYKERACRHRKGEIRDSFAHLITGEVVGDIFQKISAERAESVHDPVGFGQRYRISCDQLQLFLLSRFVAHHWSTFSCITGILSRNIFRRWCSGDPVTPKHTKPRVTAEKQEAANSPPTWSDPTAPAVGAAVLDPWSCRVTDLTSQTSFEDFTPDVLDQENEESDESYSFRCCRPGLYRCRVTGLLFLMDGEGEVVYRTVPWDRRLLAQYGKKPAGPLFDITCVQQSVCQLHLPHCEISSTGGRRFLWVAHVNHDGLEIIRPHQTTETHVIINISGFSGYGNIKDEDSPAVPIRAMVLLFYRPSADPDVKCVISVLMLPRNVVLLNVQRVRKSSVRFERYIETTSYCKLLPDQDYTLSSCPEEKSVQVKPTKAEFDSENYSNFIPSFQVSFKGIRKNIELFLRETSSSLDVWEGEGCLTLAPVSSRLSCQTLLDIRSSWVVSVSGPVLNSLLDHLLGEEVISYPEMVSANAIQDKCNKARSVLDTVMLKGEAASKIMIDFLCNEDSFLSENLG